MATIPIYDETTLPCITYSMKNKREKTKRYLGNRGISGETYATVKMMARTDAEIQALETFWIEEINYGLEPFLIDIPAFGLPLNGQGLPTLLVKCISDMEYTKEDENRWTMGMELKILGTLVYIVDDQQQFITSDTGDFMLTDDGNYISTENINSYRSVTTIIVQ